jgi:hypothetical protein
MREVQGCSAYRSQNSLTVHFGLGSSTSVDRIRIRWPSGAVQDTSLQVVDQRFMMTERVTLVGAMPNDAGTALLALAAPAPNPTPGSARFAYSLATASPGRLTIVDAQGRTVRVLEQGTLTAGAHSMGWDGLDTSGARVAGGIYWCVLDAAGTRASRRIAIVR